MTVRTRLALLFAAAVTMLVIATCSITYVVVRSSLRSTARGDAVTLARTAASLEDIHEISLDRIAGPGARVWLTNGSGAVVAQNHAAGPRTARLSDVNRAIANAPGGSTAARAPRRHGGSAIVLLANPTLDSSLSTLLSTLIAVGLAMVAASALAGALLARRVLEPVDRMRRQVDAIPGDELDRRIGEGRPDELGRLAAAFNRLLARAQRATEEQQRFIADASHELRTPVTALQGHARIVDRAAQRGDLEQARESALIVAQTSARLARTLSELLTLAAGAGGGGDPLRPQRLDRIAGEACAELQAAHPGRRVDAQLSEATVDGEPRRLGELVRILLDNAIKYSSADQPVSISVADSPDGARLEVRDHGAGFSDEDRAHAFDRFYRGSASRGVGGSGLGLAIAGSIAEQHHAGIRLEDAPGGGTAAVVRFRPA